MIASMWVIPRDHRNEETLRVAALGDPDVPASYSTVLPPGISSTTEVPCPTDKKVQARVWLVVRCQRSQVEVAKADSDPDCQDRQAPAVCWAKLGYRRQQKESRIEDGQPPPCRTSDPEMAARNAARCRHSQFKYPQRIVADPGGNLCRGWCEPGQKEQAEPRQQSDQHGNPKDCVQQDSRQGQDVKTIHDQG